MKVLMVGVSDKRAGGMWTVANNFISNLDFKTRTGLEYIPTSTDGNIVEKLFFSIKGMIKIIKYLNKEKVDIVHVHMAEKGSVYRKALVLMFAKKKGCKTIIQMHAGPIMNWYNNRSSINQRIIRNIFNSSDLFLTLGNYWSRQVSKIVLPSKIRVLYNGVTIPDVNNYNKESRDIVFVGRINKKKGIIELLDAMKLLNEKLERRYKCLIYGTDEIGNISEMIEERGLKDRVVYKGWINESQIINVYKSAVLNILPSHTECLSMNILEAMSMGVPCVTTDITTMREMIPFKEDLVKVGDKKELADRIFKLILNKDERQKKSEILYNLAKDKFSIRQISEDLINIYSELI